MSCNDATNSGNRIQIAVRQLRSAMERVGTDEQAVWDALTGLFADERAMVSHLYRDSYGVTLLQHIAQEFSNSSVFGDELQKTLELWSHGGLSVAQRIYFAVQGWGTDDPALQAALAEIRNLTPAEVETLRTQYAALSGGETLDAAILDDLGGRDRLRAQQALRGVPNGILGESQRLIEEHDHEVTDASNWFGTNLVNLLNDTYANEQRAFQNLQAAHQAYATNATPANEAPLRQAISDYRQHLQSFQESRDSVGEAFANTLTTAVGVTIAVTTLGAGTPISISLILGSTLAGAGTQVAARVLIQGNTYSTEMLLTDLAAGGLAGATAVLNPFNFSTNFESALARFLAGAARGGLNGGSIGFVQGARTTALQDTTWEAGLTLGFRSVFASGFTNAVMGVAMGAPLDGFLAAVRRFQPPARTVSSEPVRAVGANDEIAFRPTRPGETAGLPEYNPIRRIEARRPRASGGEPGATDAMLEELLARTTPHAANIPEIERALSQSSFEGLFVINEAGEVIARVRGAADTIDLSDEVIALMRGNTTIHNHPSLSGPSIADLVGAIGRGEKEMIVISGNARYRIQIPTGTVQELERLAWSVPGPAATKALLRQGLQPETLRSSRTLDVS